jgi:type I restriction enzyme S subunit
MVKGAYPALKTEPGEYPLVVTAAHRRSSSTYQLEGPAVCVPLVSSTGHGDAAIHRIHYQEGKFALADLLVALLPRDPGLCNTKYLYYLLTAKKDEYLVSLMIGTANVSLKVTDIAKVEIILPDISEQRRRVAYLDELSMRVAELKRLAAEIGVEADTLFACALEKAFKGEL